MGNGKILLFLFMIELGLGIFCVQKMAGEN